MNKYERLIEDLHTKGEGSMKCHGNSMLPILPNPSLCHYRREEKYNVGDIVFCRVKGRYIDAHLITNIRDTHYLIANNKGWQNGWTRKVYGRVIKAFDNAGNIVYGN